MALSIDGTFDTAVVTSLTSTGDEDPDMVVSVGITNGATEGSSTGPSVGM